MAHCCDGVPHFVFAIALYYEEFVMNAAVLETDRGQLEVRTVPECFIGGRAEIKFLRFRLEAACRS